MLVTPPRLPLPMPRQVARQSQEDLHHRKTRMDLKERMQMSTQRTTNGMFVAIQVGQQCLSRCCNVILPCAIVNLTFIYSYSNLDRTPPPTAMLTWCIVRLLLSTAGPRTTILIVRCYFKKQNQLRLILCKALFGIAAFQRTNQANFSKSFLTNDIQRS